MHRAWLVSDTHAVQSRLLANSRAVCLVVGAIDTEDIWEEQLADGTYRPLQKSPEADAAGSGSSEGSPPKKQKPDPGKSETTAPQVAKK
eukprot:SAG31_NODE_34711_length_330_cov_0.714286_1_plen_88_part_01